MMIQNKITSLGFRSSDCPCAKWHRVPIVQLPARWWLIYIYYSSNACIAWSWISDWRREGSSFVYIIKFCNQSQYICALKRCRIGRLWRTFPTHWIWGSHQSLVRQRNRSTWRTPTSTLYSSISRARSSKLVRISSYIFFYSRGQVGPN